MWRRGLALGVALIATTVAEGVAGAQVIDTENPRTGLEASNRGDWSTEEELAALLGDLADTSPRVTLEDVGRSAQGRSIRLVGVREPSAEPVLTVLFVCSQHGDEPAPREACARLAQRLAAPTDRAARILATAEVLFIPDANPDGRAAGTRYNTAGVDVNRDHLRLETEEARAIASVLRDERPDLVIDAHEYIYAAPVLSDDDVQYLWIRNRNAHRSLHELSRSLGEDHVEPAARRAGYTTDTYGAIDVFGQDIAQNGGGPDPKGLREAASLRNAVTILLESNANPRFTSVEENVDDHAMTERRVDSQLVMYEAVLDFAVERTDEVLAARETARATAGRTGPLYIGGTEATPPTRQETIDPAPCAYEVPGTAADGLARFLDLWAVEHTGGPDGGLVVPLDQEAAPVLPFALDPRSSFALVRATRQPCAEVDAGGAAPTPAAASETATPSAGRDPAGRLPATGGTVPWPAVTLVAAALALRRALAAGRRDDPARAHWGRGR